MTNKPPTTILLVDDDPLIRVLGQELLEHLGYRVETAGDGSEALEKFQRLGQVDLVLLDYYLPGQTGCQVLRAFKALDGHTRVLVASGSISSQDLDCLKAEGALGLIHKQHRIKAVLAGHSGF